MPLQIFLWVWSVNFWNMEQPTWQSHLSVRSNSSLHISSLNAKDHLEVAHDRIHDIRSFKVLKKMPWILLVYSQAIPTSSLRMPCSSYMSRLLVSLLRSQWSSPSRSHLNKANTCSFVVIQLWLSLRNDHGWQ